MDTEGEPRVPAPASGGVGDRQKTPLARTLQPLQWSALVFMVPALCVAVVKREMVVAAVLFAVLQTSLVVHRPGREAALGVWDYADFFAIFLWCVACRGVYMRPQTGVARGRGGVGFAAAVVALAVARVRWPVRSQRRQQIHMAMHFCGVAGTLCLIW